MLIAMLAAGLCPQSPAALVPARAGRGEPPPSAADIVVTAAATDDRVLPPGVALTPDALVERQPRTVADALRGLPGIAVRTNSRGEAVPRVRGSEERQTAVFLDGAPLVVPWDGRVDLGIIPAGLIARIDIRKGAVPIEYGANAVAGVVDLQTRAGGEEAEFLAVAQVGTLGIADFSGVLRTDVSGTDLTLGASRRSQDAVRVASLRALPFSQLGGRRRTNTRSDATTAFAAVGRNLNSVSLRASVLHFSARRGVAPESDRDPTLFAPRYWRYPDIDFTQLTVAAEARLAPGVTARLVGWRQWFTQSIEAYDSVEFAALRSREQHDDETNGGRLTVAHAAGPFGFRLSVSGQGTRHVQTDTSFPGGAESPRLRFRQDLLSFGGEADLALGPATRFTGGIAYDRSTHPVTGDKPAQPASSSVAFSAALRHRFDERLTLTLSGGRRTRFPSARELFGEALGRFAPNFDLRPETVWLADAELVFAGTAFILSLNPFLTRTTAPIAQRVLRIGERSFRQRFNLPGATSFGIDGQLRVSAGAFKAELTGTVLSARADAGPAGSRELVQRPSYEVAAAVGWAPAQAFELRAELRLIGAAVDLAPDGRLTRLPPSAELSVRASVPVARVPNGWRLSVTGAVDNLTDALVLPQIGLPLPGRTIRLGIRVQ